MISSVLKSIFGSRNDRLLKQYRAAVLSINKLEAGISRLSDDELRQKTEAFRQRFAQGETLDALLPEAFAVVREGSTRALGMRHYDVQLIGGMVLHLGKIAEMRTGEGKTLVATLPVYLNALEGKGVDVVSPGMPHSDKHAAYAADITYGTNNEIGFDYLRDNMALSKQDRYQRDL